MLDVSVVHPHPTKRVGLFPLSMSRIWVFASHPGIRKATTGVEGWQQSEAQVFGHMQELVLVPLHVLTAVSQHHSHGMPPQQTSENTHTHALGTKHRDFLALACSWTAAPFAACQRAHLTCHFLTVHVCRSSNLISPEDTYVGFEDRHHDVVVQPHIRQHSSHGNVKLCCLVQQLEMRGNR